MSVIKIQKIMKKVEYHQERDNCKDHRKMIEYLKKNFDISKDKFNGNYLVFLFIFVIFLYTIIPNANFFILNFFFDTNFILIGIDVIRKIWNGDDWSQRESFPLKTFCDFSINEGQYEHKYNVFWIFKTYTYSFIILTLLKITLLKKGSMFIVDKQL